MKDHHLTKVVISTGGLTISNGCRHTFDINQTYKIIVEKSYECTI